MLDHLLRLMQELSEYLQSIESRLYTPGFSVALIDSKSRHGAENVLSRVREYRECQLTSSRTCACQHHILRKGSHTNSGKAA